VVDDVYGGERWHGGGGGGDDEDDEEQSKTKKAYCGRRS
jgi:hypothetical protein